MKKANDIGNTLYYIKSVNELKKGDIILHPIYRLDGLLISNEFTRLTDFTVSQTRVHLNPTTPNIVLKEEASIEDFINNSGFTEDGFITNIIKIIEKAQYTNISKLSLNAYINYRAKGEVKSKLIDILTDLPMWNFFEERFESQNLRSRARAAKIRIMEAFHTPYLTQLTDKMYEYDEQIIIQGLNSMCMAVFLGLGLELTIEALVELAIAGIMCNAGFINVDKKIFRDFIHGEYYESLVNEHINIVLDIFEKSPYARNKNILYGIMEHHEYYNGSGYPSGKCGEEISLYGRILNIAHEYDDMVSGCYGKQVLATYEAQSMLWRDEEKRFDRDIIKLFIYRTNIFKIGGQFINLHNEKGIIVGFRNFIEKPLRPIVQYEDGRIIDYYVD